MVSTAVIHVLLYLLNPVRHVAHGDGLSSQKSQLLAQSRLCRQTVFFSMWDYLQSDREIAQLQVDIAEHKNEDS